METTPCPFWEDGVHAWRDDSRGGEAIDRPMYETWFRDGLPLIPVKQCACGAEVKGKPVVR